MLTQEELVQVLENSEDWYIIIKVESGGLIVKYTNKQMHAQCPGECAIHAFSNECDNLENCAAFKPLVPIIRKVHETRQRTNIPQYEFKCIHRLDFKFVDLQIYRNNGHVVLCARDLSPNIYNLRTAAANLSKRLDYLLENSNNVNH